jgi:hypothetical protein
MIPVNGLMNHIAEMAHAETFFTRHVSTRFAVLCGVFPLELSASFENLIKATFQTGLIPLSLSCKAINLCIDSQRLKNFTDWCPSIVDVFKTALKVAGYALGAFVTLSFGFLRPYDNFKLHVFFQLIRDEKAFAKEQAILLQRIIEREEQEKAMQTHIENLLLLMREKAAQREAQFISDLNKGEISSTSSQITPIQTSSREESEDEKKTMEDEIKKRLIHEFQRIVSTQPATNHI